ncbi:hypothetical protein D3C78_1433830 [compost metagenome]
MIPVIGGVAFPHTATHMLRVRADHDTRTLGEVVDGRAFLKELRIRANVERQCGSPAFESGLYGCLYLVGGADGHGGLVDHDLVILHVLANGLGYSEHILQIGGAVLVRRSAYGDKLQFAKIDTLRGVCGEAQAAFRVVAFHHRL